MPGIFQETKVSGCKSYRFIDTLLFIHVCIHFNSVLFVSDLISV